VLWGLAGGLDGDMHEDFVDVLSVDLQCAPIEAVFDEAKLAIEGDGGFVVRRDGKREIFDFASCVINDRPEEETSDADPASFRLDIHTPDHAAVARLQKRTLAETRKGNERPGAFAT